MSAIDGWLRARVRNCYVILNFTQNRKERPYDESSENKSVFKFSECSIDLNNILVHGEWCVG